MAERGRPFGPGVGLQEQFNEGKFARDFETSERLGGLKRFTNALLDSQIGFQPFQRQNVSMFNPATASPEDLAIFGGLTPAQQAFATSDSPGELGQLLGSKGLSEVLAMDPTVLQKRAQLMKDSSNMSDAQKESLGLSLLSAAEEGGIIGPGVRERAISLGKRNAMRADELADVLTMYGSAAETGDRGVFDVGDAVLQNAENAADMKESDLRNSRLDESSKIANTASTRAGTIEKLTGKWHRFADGFTMTPRNADGSPNPEWARRLADGQTPILTSSSSGTESGVNSVISTADRSDQALMFQNAIRAKEQVLDLNNRLTNPDAFITGPVGGLLREGGAGVLARIPGVGPDLVQGATNMSPAEIQALRTEIATQQFNLAEPYINEPRKTDEERRVVRGTITEPGLADTKEQIAGRNWEIWRYMDLNADKNLFSSAGRFTYDVTNPDPELAAQERDRWIADANLLHVPGEEAPEGSSQEKVAAATGRKKKRLKNGYKSFRRNQLALRSMGQRQVRDRFSTRPEDLLPGANQ